MGLAAPFILVQKNLKRMLAGSTFEHVGLICVGIGLSTPVTVFGALLHMGYHALTKPVPSSSRPATFTEACHTL